MIDWNNIIKELKNGVNITPDKSKWNLTNPDYLDIYNQWEEANFNMSAVFWINFYPDIHFDNSIVEQIAKTLNVGIHRAWISQINPGYFAPWHWDADDSLDIYIKKGTPRRFSIFISNPNPAHFFTTDNNTFSNTTQGTVYEWKNFNSWHAGANAGLIPKYMFHLLGY